MVNELPHLRYRWDSECRWASMGLFKRNKRTTTSGVTTTPPPATEAKPTPPTVDWGDVAPIDIHLGDTELADAVESLKSGAWGDAERLLATRDKPPLLSLGSKDVSLETFVNWAETNPSPAVLTIVGQAFIAHAWEIRGKGYADTVEDWGGVNDRLDKARAYFERAIATDPTFVEAEAGLLTLDMTGSASLAKKRSRFERIHEHEPFHAGAVWTMVQILAPKWGGEVEQMMEFARWVAAEAPDGSPALQAIPDAHWELAILGAHDGKGLFEHMREPAVVEECRTAFGRLLAGLPDEGEAPTTHVKALNTFLFFSGLRDAFDLECSRKGYRILGDRPTERPWEYIARGKNPREVFLQARFDRAWRIDRILKTIEAQRAATAS